MAASIRDVAKRAGVSISTVSRILNNSAAVSEEKAAAVRQAVEYFHYEPNQFGRGLVKQTSHMIGVYFPFSAGSVFDSSYNLELLKGMEKVFARDRYSMVLISENEESGKRPDPEPKFMDAVRQKRIDGLLITGVPQKPGAKAAIQQVLSEEFPMVYIGKRLHEKSHNVYAQYEKYVYQMIELLYRNGHRVLLMYYHPKVHEAYVRNLQERIRREMPEATVYLESCVDIDEAFRERVKGEVHEYVSRRGCTAICSPGMECTRILLSICAEWNYSIPKDLSILSVEHKAGEGQLLFPPISSFYVPAKAMGIGASELLLKLIQDPDAAEQFREFETVPIARDSIRHL